MRCSWKDRICSSIDRSTLRTSTPGGHLQHAGREVQDARDAGRDEPVADVLRGRGGRRDDADRGAGRAHDLGQVVEVAHDEAADLLADAGRVGVEQPDDAEAALVEAAVAGERVAEVADADEHDRPALRQAERAR